MITLDITQLGSPLGDIHLAVREGRLCALEFAERWPARLAWLERRLGRFERRAAADSAGVAHRLGDYFAGRLDALDAVAVEPLGTPFQRGVWHALRSVTPGSVVSYGALARTLGVPSAPRAVGAANGANPIAIVVPCHRAVGADGRLVGYAGGLARKRWLLAHEQRFAPQSAPERVQ